MAQDLVETCVFALVADGNEVPVATYGRTSPDGGHVMLTTTDGMVQRSRT